MLYPYMLLFLLEMALLHGVVKRNLYFEGLAPKIEIISWLKNSFYFIYGKLLFYLLYFKIVHEKFRG